MESDSKSINIFFYDFLLLEKELKKKIFVIGFNSKIKEVSKEVKNR